jgi:hypothetical protein
MISLLTVVRHRTELARRLQTAVLFILSSGSIDSLHIHDNGKLLFRLLKWTFAHVHDEELLLSAASTLAKAALSRGERVAANLQKVPHYKVLRGVFGLFGNALEQQLFVQAHASQSSPFFEQNAGASVSEAPIFLTFEQLAQKRFSEDSIRKDITEALAEVEVNRALLLKLLEPFTTTAVDFASMTSVSRRSELLNAYSRCLESLNILTILQRQIHRLGFSTSEKIPFLASMDRDCWMSRELLHIVRDVIVHLPAGKSEQLEWMFQSPELVVRLFSSFCTNMGDSARDKSMDIVTAILSRSSDAELAAFIVEIMKTHFSQSSEDTSPQFFLFECLCGILKSRDLQPSSSRVLLKLISAFDGKSGLDASALTWVLFLMSSLLLGNKREVAHPDSSCRQCGVSPICGTRWRCINCLDYDLCSSCEPHQRKINSHNPETHACIKIPRPLPLTPTRTTKIAVRAPLLQNSEAKSTGGARNAHKGSKCSGCGMSPIFGVRWQCSSCPNYNLCDKCESSIVMAIGSKDGVQHHPHHFFVKWTQAVPDATFADTNLPLIKVTLHQMLYPVRGAVCTRPKSKSEIQAALGATYAHHPFFKTDVDVSQKDNFITYWSVKIGSVGREVLFTLLSVLRQLLSNSADDIRKNVESIIAVARCLQDLAPYAVTADDIFAAIADDSADVFSIVALLQTLHRTQNTSNITTKHSQSDWWSANDESGHIAAPTASLSATTLRLIRSEIVNVIQSLVVESTSPLHKHPAARLARATLRSRLIQAFISDPMTSNVTLEVLNAISSQNDIRAEIEPSSSAIGSADDSVALKSEHFPQTAEILLVFRPLVQLLPSLFIENSIKTQTASQALNLLCTSYDWASNNGFADQMMLHTPFDELWNAIVPFTKLKRGLGSVFSPNLDSLIRASAQYYRTPLLRLYFFFSNF